MKILAVDDEIIQLKMLERAIKTAVPGAEPVCFENPIEALKWSMDNAPEIAFCDLRMPLMNGIELAKELKRHFPMINIIFVTGFYKEYAASAAPLRFSGYLQKPVTADAVKLEMENLRFPIEHKADANKLTVRCFGSFEVMMNSKPLEFKYSKTKELLAYLIDRKGAEVNGNDILAALYEEDNPNYKSHLRNCVADLKNTLRNVDAEAVFIKGFNKYSVDVSLIDCDYYDWEKGEAYAIRTFKGEYMSQYSWAETTLAYLTYSL